MESTERIRVLTADDHPVLREGIAALLEAQNDMFLVGEAANGREAIELFRKHRPDVTLMDLELPEMSGIDAIAEIRREFPQARILVLTTYKGDVHAARALEVGALGYLLKNALRKELLDAIRAVHAGRKCVPAEIAIDIIEHHYSDPLTTREIEVLRLIAAGNANKAIAAELHVADETVKGHVSTILAKLGANDRTHAVTIALKRGIMHLD